MKLISTIFTILIVAGIQLEAKQLPFNTIKLPPGFAIELYASGLQQVRSLSMSPDGILFAGSKSGYVYAISQDKRVITIDSGLDWPVGIDFYQGNLYVSTHSNIIIYPDIIHNILVPKKKNYYRGFPEDRWHGWRYIRTGPDGALYVSVGMPCNVCEKRSPMYGSIVRIDPGGKTSEVYVEGIRFSVGFDWSPQNGTLWFTDNGRDGMGDDTPPDELNKVSFKGEDFGFPYIHGKSVTDPQYWTKRKHNSYTSPEIELPAHVASLGIRFYNKSAFPTKYHGGVFIAEHGSVDRSVKTGYRISFVQIQKNKALSYEIFAQGWLKNYTKWGRLADVEIANDGSLLISDDRAHAIYRIYYTGKETHKREL